MVGATDLDIPAVLSLVDGLGVCFGVDERSARRSLLLLLAPAGLRVRKRKDGMNFL